MTTTALQRPPESPSDSALPLVSFWCGVITFIVGVLALPLWVSGYGAFLAIWLDFIALTPFVIALLSGLAGLKENKAGLCARGHRTGSPSRADDLPHLPAPGPRRNLFRF